jgi:hypothetical protein
MAFEESRIFVPKRYYCPQCGRQGTTDPISFNLIAANCSQANCPLKRQAKDNRRGCGIVLVLALATIGIITIRNALQPNLKGSPSPARSEVSEQSEAQPPSEEHFQPTTALEDGSSSTSNLTENADQSEKSIESASPAIPLQSDVIERVTIRALDSGRPERWRLGKQNGYVVPSAEQAFGDRVCRDVIVSWMEKGKQQVGKPIRWCRSPSEEWRVQSN